MVVTPVAARVLAEEFFDRGRGLRPEVWVHAFDAGYVAWTRDDEPADPSLLPETVGAGCIVIDRTTGQIAVRPLLSPDSVAEQWPNPVPR